MEERILNIFVNGVNGKCRRFSAGVTLCPFSLFIVLPERTTTTLAWMDERLILPITLLHVFSDWSRFRLFSVANGWCA